METQNLDTSLISVATKTSSWPILRGSLDDAVICESSISALDSDSVDLSRKSPLVLRRRPTDCGPCDITISFTQLHEIRQVYVRSTARVYEIYYAADEKGGQEYLCTVRCGIAAGNEELLQETNVAGSLSTSCSSSDRSSYEGCSKTESGSSSNEDGWVDVKVVNPSRLDAGDSCLSDKEESCMEQGNQDCFEATAEISDADPVLSVTLRLLSIQSGDYVYIDEVYVFADPLVSADTNSSTNSLETSPGNSMMSMLIPTLLQLSKSRMNQMQERSGSAGEERRKHQDAELKSTCAAIISNTSQSESVQSTQHDGASAHMFQPEVPVQMPEQNKPYSSSRGSDFSRSHIERTLDELLSRVAKIEQFCLRFEENMLMPITDMEARLERVEQQLELFSKNPQFSGTTCTRVSAPEMSCNESESTSICTGANECSETIKSEAIKKDAYCLQELRIPPSDTYSSHNVVQPFDVSSSTTNASHLLPSLVVTAPDFSYIEDEEENDPIEAVEDSPKDSPKKPLSIDDALASALAGFLCSASINSVMVDEAANMSSIEGSKNTSLSALIQSDELVVPSIYIDGGNISGNDNAGTEPVSLDADYGCEETTESVGHNDILKEMGSMNSLVANLDQDKMEGSDLKAEIQCAEADDEPSQICVSDHSVALTIVNSPPSNDVPAAALEVPGGSIETSSGEEIAKEWPDILQNILKLPSPPIVDFGVPILDVKFLSQESSSAKSSLDVLLVDVPERQSEAPCVREDNKTSLSEQYDLVMIENEEPAISESFNNQLLSLDICDSGYMPSNSSEDEKRQDPYKSSNEDICPSLL